MPILKQRTRYIDQLNLFIKYEKYMSYVFFFFFSHKHDISNMYTAYYISGQVATERTPKPSQEGLERCHVHRKVEALPASYPFTPELRTPCQCLGLGDRLRARKRQKAWDSEAMVGAGCKGGRGLGSRFLWGCGEKERRASPQQGELRECQWEGEAAGHRV